MSRFLLPPVSALAWALAAGCAPGAQQRQDGAPADGSADGADADADADADTDSDTDTDTDTDSPVAVGGFTVEGVVQDADSGAAVPGACVGVADPMGAALGEPLPWLGQATADGAGHFEILDVPAASTLGLLLVADDCADLGPLGEDSSRVRLGDWAPTGSLLPVERWAALGPEDRLTVVQPLISQGQLAALAAELEAAGAWNSIDEGALLGQVVNDDGEPFPAAWLRGPESIQVLYSGGGGSWLAWSHTTAAGAARYVIPTPPWGAYLAWGPEVEFPTQITGGIPGLLLLWDFQAMARHGG